jgi:hypothetical protein
MHSCVLIRYFVYRLCLISLPTSRLLGPPKSHSCSRIYSAF